MKKAMAIAVLVVTFVLGVVGSSFARERVYRYHSGGRRHRTYHGYRQYYPARYRRYRRRHYPSAYYYYRPRRVYYYYYYGPYHWDVGFDCY